MTVLQTSASVSSAIALRDGTMTGPGSTPTSVTLTTSRGSGDVPVGHEAVAEALSAWDGTPTTVAALVASMTACDMAAAVGLHQALARLTHSGHIAQIACQGATRVAALGTLGVASTRLASDVPEKIALSAHAVMTPTPQGMVRLVSGASRLYVDVTAGLLEPIVAGTLHDVPAPVRTMLWTARLVRDAERDATCDELRWDAISLLFHRRTADMSYGAPYGGTYPLLDHEPPPPLDKPEPENTTQVALPEPSGDASLTLGATFATRRSVRHFDTQPLALEDVATLLGMALRVKAVFPGEHGQELAAKPVPAGGSIHEIEAYYVTTTTDGLEAGAYRYDSVHHRLVRYPVDGDAAARMVAQVCTPLGDPQAGHSAVVLTARFDRLMWKYQGVAYPLVLKHVGVVYEALYLSAHAAGLGVCAVGGQDATTLSGHLGLDPLREDVVGGLAVGRPRLEDPAP